MSKSVETVVATLEAIQTILALYSAPAGDGQVPDCTAMLRVLNDLCDAPSLVEALSELSNGDVIVSLEPGGHNRVIPRSAH